MLRIHMKHLSRWRKAGCFSLLDRCHLLIGTLLIVSAALFPGNSSRAEMGAAENQEQIRETDSQKTIIDLQASHTSQSAVFEEPDGKPVELTLLNLNPNVNQWYLLKIKRNGNGEPEVYHLENPYPNYQRLALDKRFPDTLVFSLTGETFSCAPWQFSGESELDTARKSRQAFAPLCDGKIYLRNPTKGHQTAIESVTGFLRDRLPGGETVVGFVKDTFFQDAYLETPRTTAASDLTPAATDPDFPIPAAIDPAYAQQMIGTTELGIQLEHATTGMLTGQWYRVKNNPGVFVSLIQPRAVASEILKSHANLVSRLDSVEAAALAYLVAFDLDRFDLGFAVGTEHPRVGWSERTLAQMRVPGLPGPDGIGTIAPLAANGMVNPVEAARAVATFTGGFKRSHGAFKYGDLANHNHGSHYGFMEKGVVFSTLQPGLATLLVRDDKTVEMKTWSEADNEQLGHIVTARQNGVPLVEWDGSAQQPVPGRLVGKWGPGNWSGSEDKKLRTLRAGAALQQTDTKRFLIYGYFSTATPSAMARVFQAYHCRYAMHLDMNALEHTYLALYHRQGGHLKVQHLIKGMSVLDKLDNTTYIPRFLGYSDNRDFFYLMRHEQP